MDSPRSEFLDSPTSGGASAAAAGDDTELDVIMSQLGSEEGEDGGARVRAAREIRRLTKTCSANRRLLAPAIHPLVEMLRREGDEEGAEAAILALLNLGVKDERNKINIVKAGALDPIINLLQSQNPNLVENATAAMLTLTACSANKPAICFSGAIPLLVSVLSNATNPQTKIDSLMALYNLSTLPDSVPIILSSDPIPSLVALLKSLRKSSKTAEKCMALLEPLLGFEDGRAALIAEPGGVLSVVELLEEGSSVIKEFAVCALLTMCESDREKYREIILREGVIPSLLELSVKGATAKSRWKARALLQLLRESPPRPKAELEAAALENMVSDIVMRVDGGDRGGKAKKMLAEMVQVSMEQSLRHMQQRALMCTSNRSK